MKKESILFKQKIFYHTNITKTLLKIGACASVLVVAACNDGSNSGPVTNAPLHVNTKKQVGILLPLSGRNGVLGNNMLQATKLAMSDPSSPKLDIQDTEQQGGAAEAARKAVAAGDGIILGPLTAQNTSDVATAVTNSNIPVIAYTSDVSVATPNVWVFGITPEQQVSTLVNAAKAQGKTKFAALLPDNAFGHAMANALNKSCASAGLTQPIIEYHSQSSDDISAKLKKLSNYDIRVQEAKNNPEASSTISANSNADDNGGNLLDELAPSGKAASSQNSQLKLGAPPFDALLLSDTGLQLQSVINALKDDQISAPQVQIMGPGLWGAFASKLGALHGAWYVSPNPQLRQVFASQYRAKYGYAAKPLSDLAYDTAALANSLSKIGGYTKQNLTRAQGFDGVDGLFVLQSDGHVKRDLQIFQIQPAGGGKMISTPSMVKSGT